MILSLLIAAMTVLPVDRMAMADRLFNRGKYAEAETEYKALEGEKSIAADELSFRLAEVERATGRTDSARKRYSEIALNFPHSKHASQCRFLYAMGAKGEDRRKLLAALDSDRVEPSVRAAALYNLALETNSAADFERCINAEPKGKYAEYARLRYGVILSGDSSPDTRRKGIDALLSIAFSKSELAEEALYLAALQSYRGKKYNEAGMLFRHYLKAHSNGPHADEAKTMIAWSDFSDGRYADAVAACGAGGSDDFDYILAASAYAVGEKQKALTLFRKYLETYPSGRYRADAELPIARIEFDMASGNTDGAKTVEAAKRGFSLSKLAADELRLAWAYEKTGRIEEAKNEYSLVAGNFPGSEEAVEALYRKALIEAKAKNWTGVELALAEGLASGKGAKFKGEMLYWRGIAAIRIGHEAEGARFLSDALKERLGLDENREARLMLADMDYRNGRLDKAKDAYRQLVAEGACERMSSARILSVGRLLGGENAKTCAMALVKFDSAEWRQAGWTLLGETEEAANSFSAAIDAYRKAMAENVTTAEASRASLRLGLLEVRAGEHDKAEETLKKAVTLNGDDPRARAEAYTALAKNSEAKGDKETAVAYATVVTSLFDDAEFCREANEILKKYGEDAK